MSLVDVKTALRRDFKIMGVIGGEEQKDRLSFVSLIRQIDAGMDKGYKEREIIKTDVTSPLQAEVRH